MSCLLAVGVGARAKKDLNKTFLDIISALYDHCAKLLWLERFKKGFFARKAFSLVVIKPSLLPASYKLIDDVVVTA